MTSAVAAWQALEAELGAWSAAGLRAQLWWRDDDAGAPSPALERLLDLAAASRAPLSLAVIPARAERALAAALAAHAAETTVLQHGYAHINHAVAGGKKCELVDPARRPALLGEVKRGYAALAKLFGARLLPVMVPPWNRIDAALTTRLPGLGFVGLSTCKARRAAAATPGLAQANCHLDILRWRPERRFLGTAACLDLLTGHLAAKRTGAADTDEPSGILSHHWAHDEPAWSFLSELLQYLARHRAVQLLPAADVFAVPCGSRRARESRS